jgi:sorting nexin-8
MSLFGTSPGAEAPRAAAKSSLFDDDAPAQSSARRQGGSGLFADESNDEEGSPWGFPTPRRQARGNPVKTLLTGADVPESYIDAYDALLESGESARNGVALAGVKRVLAGSGVSSDVQQQILKIVMPNGEDEAGLGRAEFNVVLAMIGLAQEGEEVSLDGVDERKRRMSPVTSA